MTCFGADPVGMCHDMLGQLVDRSTHGDQGIACSPELGRALDEHALQ